MRLHDLQPNKGAKRKRKRIGRGQGSGKGGTSTRGHKGAKSRSGYKTKKGFEGGQMPLQRRVPKFGFKNINRVAYKAINLDSLQQLVDTYQVNVVDFDFLKSHGIVSKKDLVKILGRGEITAKLEDKAHKYSMSAKEAIEYAGGTATEIA
ncbi:MAG: 50S ribosomal protein L15 [Thermonemataceae bacterium]